MERPPGELAQLILNQMVLLKLRAPPQPDPWYREPWRAQWEVSNAMCLRPDADIGFTDGQLQES